MTDKPEKRRPSISPREDGQPYTTENENYRFDVVKSPTEPDQRRVGKENTGTGKVAHPHGHGASNKGRK